MSQWYDASLPRWYGEPRLVHWTDPPMPDDWRPSPAKPTHDFSWGIFIGAIFTSAAWGLALIAVWPG